MAEGERPKERAERGGGHHPVSEHGPGRPRPQLVRVVDLNRPGNPGGSIVWKGRWSDAFTQREEVSG